MKKLLLLIPLFFSACIGEDIINDEVQPEIRITNPIISLEISTSYQFEFMMINNVGEEVQPDVLEWSSSDASILTINNSGLAMALDYGEITIRLTASLDGFEVSEDFTFEVTDQTISTLAIRGGTIATTSSYKLKGDFELTQDGNDLILAFDNSYEADTGLPGLYVYLSNNPNSSAGAREIAAVTKFNGAHSYTIGNVGLYDYQFVLYFCKPFNVKVGHGEITDPQ